MAQEIQLSASDRGIVDYFECFACDKHVLDCDHLIDERLASAEHARAVEPSSLHSFAYDGKRRVLEIEFRVLTHTPTGTRLPLAPRRVAKPGWLMECENCGRTGVNAIRHRNCIWSSL